mmetsp:Transcript_16149/g.25059  ORF Transcript_16149/g.25059 Transcript_16149/m.25059 type:complete len:94 (+) Transcript_16149:650-931(+)
MEIQKEKEKQIQKVTAQILRDKDEKRYQKLAQRRHRLTGNTSRETPSVTFDVQIPTHTLDTDHAPKAEIVKKRKGKGKGWKQEKETERRKKTS